MLVNRLYLGDFTVSRISSIKSNNSTVKRNRKKITYKKTTLSEVSDFLPDSLLEVGFSINNCLPEELPAKVSEIRLLTPHSEIVVTYSVITEAGEEYLFNLMHSNTLIFWRKINWQEVANNPIIQSALTIINREQRSQSIH